MSLNKNKNRDTDKENDNKNNSSNKKQKLDNDKDDNNNNDNEIDITNLEKRTIPQLKEIANTIGLTITNGTRKHEIIMQIKSIQKGKQDLLSKKEYSNPFSMQIEFTIKDGIDPLEWLFWKVFRNKFLYKKVMSFMDTQLSMPYHSIISVEDLIKFNQFGILRDKVINNHYLTFGNTDKNGENFISINKIFKLFKNDQEDISFYSKLFKHYGNHIFNFSGGVSTPYEKEEEEPEKELTIDIALGREQFINQLIEFKCIPAIKVLLQEYQYQFTESNLQQSINHGHLNLIQLILDQQPTFKQNILNNHHSIRLPNSIKSLIYFQTENIINSNSQETLQFIKSIEINENMKLKTLITILKLVSNNGHDGINESFSKQELKLKLSDSIFQITDKKEIIIKLINSYYSHIGITGIDGKSEFYHLYYGSENGKYGNGVGNFDKLYQHLKRMGNDPISTSIKLSYQFANFKLLYNTFEKYNVKFGNKFVVTFLKEMVSTDKKLSFMFSHCHNKKTIDNFINSMIINIKEHLQLRCKGDPIIEAKTKKVICIATFFKFLVSYDNVELVKGFLEKVQRIHHGDLRVSITNFIKSKEMLEYTFTNHHNTFGMSFIWHFRNMELLKHFEILFNGNDQYQDSSDEETTLTITPPNKLIDVRNCLIRGTSIDKSTFNQIIKHIINSGPTVYKADFSFYSSIESCGNGDDDNISTNEKIEMFKSFFFKFVFNTSPNNIRMFVPTLLSTASSVAYIKFIDWLLNNYPDYLKRETSAENNDDESYSDNFKNQDSINISIYYTTKRYNQISNISKQSCIYLYNSHWAIQTESTEAFDYLFGEMKSFYKETNTLYSMLKSSASLGHFKLFQHLFENYNWLLKCSKFTKSSRNTTGSTNYNLPCFDSKQLKQLIVASLEGYHFKLAEYLFEVLPPLSKKEFNTNQSTIAKLYFKNKFIK